MRVAPWAAGYCLWPIQATLGREREKQPPLLEPDLPFKPDPHPSFFQKGGEVGVDCLAIPQESL